MWDYEQILDAKWVRFLTVPQLSQCIYEQPIMHVKNCFVQSLLNRPKEAINELHSFELVFYGPKGYRIVIRYQIGVMLKISTSWAGFEQPHRFQSLLGIIEILQI